MYFQIVDDNSQCNKVYVRGDLRDFSESEELSRTWKYSQHLHNMNNIKYAYAMSGGKSLHDLCPEYCRLEWQTLSHRVSSIIDSVRVSRCDLKNNCIYDFIPHNIIVELLEAKQRIIENVFNV